MGLHAGWNRVPYGYSNPFAYTDRDGLNPLAGAINGGRLGAMAGAPLGPPGTLIGGVIGATAGVWATWKAAEPLLAPDPVQASGLPPGYWPADKGAAEWGRRNGFGQQEGKGRFHGIKQGCGGRARDNFGVDPATGDVVDPEGESVGNLWEAKSK
jgi:hypothetical protein